MRDLLWPETGDSSLVAINITPRLMWLIIYLQFQVTRHYRSAHSDPMSVQQRSAGLSLAGILDSNNDAEDVLQGVEVDSSEKGEGWDEEDGVVAKEGYCIECEGVYICVYN